MGVKIMAISFDKAFGVHQYTLGVRNVRSEVLASNIANADTPGYKARDLDFKTALSQAMSLTGSKSANLTRTDDRHIPGTSGVSAADTLYRVPLQPDTGDGNTVDVQTERAEFLENALRYQASLEFLNQKITQLTKALKGDQS